MYKFDNSDFDCNYNDDLGVLEVKLDYYRPDSNGLRFLKEENTRLSSRITDLESKLKIIEDAVAEYGLLKGNIDEKDPENN